MGVQRSPTWEPVWVVVWWVKPQPQLEVWTLLSATMFRWVAKLECQNSRLYQLIATLYSKPGADLDTFSRVALKSDGVDFMYCIAYTMKIPSQPPKKPSSSCSSCLSWLCWIILVRCFWKRWCYGVCPFSEKRREDDMYWWSTFQDGTTWKKISNIPEKPKSPAFWRS